MRRGKHKDAVICKLIDARMDGMTFHKAMMSSNVSALYARGYGELRRGSMEIFRWHNMDFDGHRYQSDIPFDDAVEIVDKNWRWRHSIHHYNERKKK